MGRKAKPLHTVIKMMSSLELHQKFSFLVSSECLSSAGHGQISTFISKF